ncbi:MAG TPA: multidrug effflux MFS transporter [Gammaproteobacteria bacterium]|nr:multidrug effflux MFS transporter [Gammaproteobacteria bacterium]
MATKPKVLPTVCLLAPFVFSFAFAMDVYIPVVPEMKQYFHTNQANVQLTLSLFMVVTGLGQLLMGPITDQYGRRRIIFFSVFSFIIGSLICALSNSIQLLIAGRLVQAFGGCGMMVAAFAMVRDKFSGNDGAKVYSFLNCGLAMSPLFAPIIGSYLATWFDWRAEFVFLIAIGILVLMLALFRIKETLALEKRVKLDLGIFRRYFNILTHPIFISYACCTSAGLTIFFTFFSSSPYIIINLLHAPVKNFGYYFFTVGFTFFIGSMISGKVADKIGPFKTVLIGSIFMLVAGVSMEVWYLSMGISKAQFLLPCMLAGLGGSFMMGAGVGGAMQPFAAMAGSAAALVGCLQFLIGALVGSYVMRWQVQSTTPLAITMIVCSLVALMALGGQFILRHRQHLLAS